MNLKVWAGMARVEPMPTDAKVLDPVRKDVKLLVVESIWPRVARLLDECGVVYDAKEGSRYWRKSRVVTGVPKKSDIYYLTENGFTRLPRLSEQTPVPVQERSVERGEGSD